MALDRIISVEEMQRFIMNGYSYEEISNELQSRNSYKRGVSARTVRRFCAEHNIKKNFSASNDEKVTMVKEAVMKVGTTYGRKMMTGYLRGNGIKIAETTVGKTLRLSFPTASNHRREDAKRSLNPKPYIANYFGEKLHVDQNEKLVMYGVTHVIARDGYSGMIVATSTMPIKNNIIIYDEIFRKLTMEYGVWDTIRVDGGKEFNLLLYGQDSYSNLRFNHSKPPFRRGKSTDNHVIERIWVEVNKRVNYPIKIILNDMVHHNQIDICDKHDKFSLSWIACNVARSGIEKFVCAWNNHSIPGKGIPLKLSQKRYFNTVSHEVVADGCSAATAYESTMNGSLNRNSEFGKDVLEEFPDKRKLRDHCFKQYFPDFNALFNSVVASDCSLLRNAIIYHVALSKRLLTRNE